MSGLRTRLERLERAVRETTPAAEPINLDEFRRLTPEGMVQAIREWNRRPWVPSRPTPFPMGLEEFKALPPAEMAAVLRTGMAPEGQLP